MKFKGAAVNATSCTAAINRVDCSLMHADACSMDSDFLTRTNGDQPFCCITNCGYKICVKWKYI